MGKERIDMGKGIKVAYVHFSYRHIKATDKLIMAVVIYLSKVPRSSKIVAVSTAEETPWDGHSNNVKAIQSYAYALSYVFSKQEKIKRAGFTNLVFVTSNRVLHRNLLEGKNNAYNEWFSRANAPYRVGGIKEIELPIGLGCLSDSDYAYKYCSQKMLDNKIMLTARGVHLDDNFDNEDGYGQDSMLSVEDALKMYDTAYDIEYSGISVSDSMFGGEAQAEIVGKEKALPELMMVGLQTGVDEEFGEL